MRGLRSLIQSQQGEGWRLIETAYDDGGFSGGGLARPALQQLLADIGAGRIDAVVIAFLIWRRANSGGG